MSCIHFWHIFAFKRFRFFSQVKPGFLDEKLRTDESAFYLRKCDLYIEIINVTSFCIKLHYAVFRVLILIY